MAHFDIFREELAIKYPAYGHALWEPSPGKLYDAIEVGDVGYIREGKFHRLFNALLPGDHDSHRNFGVPEYHEPLKPKMSKHIDSGTLSPNDLCSGAVTVTSGGLDVLATGPVGAAQVSFSCSRRQGAILSLPVQAQRQDTVARGEFGRWIVKHINLWFAFTQELGLGLNRMEDIILVTGFHRARSWANIAFSEGSGGARVSFGVRVSGTSGTNVEWKYSREDIQGVVLNLGPSGQNLPEDQCIFVRGFRVTRFIRILPRLRGAAGPAPLPDGHEPEPDAQLVSVPAGTNYQDPLRTLLEYIAEVGTPWEIFCATVVGMN
ncbi:hypothetical protein B0F90DRAFT_1779787 [Multifurca ochricompacta]|uniref:Uncharacterized protein n=1 Tax=Multifurca ochricompacta TaxID=376703 RepID=A0AAD4LVC8_9AGAM|nr:hypothetical protein B0F90DRAFT_1779787 [Multifurca ochricompacta]